MRGILFIAITIIFYSCIKESNTHYVAYLINKTNHVIEIRPFYSGVAPLSNIISLGANETKEIANGNDRGINSAGAGFTSKYFAGADSCVVIFDNTYKITHYVNTPTLLNLKYYLYTSTRNIENLKSYYAETTDINKHSRENIFKYEFIEQDYLDAK